MKNKPEHHFKTREVHAGVRPDPVTGAILTPIYQATTYVQESVDDYLAKGFSYSRSGNPTVTALEDRITSLEGGAGTACFSTGMAATSAIMMAMLNAGEHAVLSDVVYGGTHRLSTRVLSRFGVEYSFVDTSDPQNVRDAIRDNTRLIFTETPGQPDAQAHRHCGDIGDRAGTRHPALRGQHVPDALLPATAGARRRYVHAQYDEVSGRAQRHRWRLGDHCFG